MPDEVAASAAEQGRNGVNSAWVCHRDWRTRTRVAWRDSRLPDRYRLVGDDGGESGDDPGARDAVEAAAEALLAAAEEPLTARRIASAVRATEPAVCRALARLRKLYDEEGSAFRLVEVAGGYQLLSAPEYYPWVRRLRGTGPELRLSTAARETLAVVAYRQPVMRAEIEAIRGVQCDDVLRTLMDKGLVRVAGRHDSLGRPVLYGTTRQFLQLLGLKSLEDLPRTADQSPTSESKRENGPAGSPPPDEI